MNPGICWPSESLPTCNAGGGSRENAYYSLYLQKDYDLAEGHDYYVRGTLSIPNRDSIRGYSARALLVVNENQPLAAMLRDSERPSHNAWYPQDDRVTKRWVGARGRISDVLNAPSRLLRILEGAPEGLQRDALADVFSWDGNWGEWLQPGAIPEPVPVPEPMIHECGHNRNLVPPLPPPPPSRPRDFTLTRTNSGFRVGISTARRGGDSFQGRLEAAYAVLRGNAFKKYREYDFRFHGDQALAVSVVGGSVSAGNAGNELLLQVDEPSNFSLIVEGFDPQRDVRVKVEPLQERQETGES